MGKVLTIACKAFNLSVISPGLVAGRAMASSICCCSAAIKAAMAWLTSWALVPAAQAACWAALPGGKVLTIACKAFNLRVISPGLVAGKFKAVSKLANSGFNSCQLSYAKSRIWLARLTIFVLSALVFPNGDNVTLLINVCQPFFVLFIFILIRLLSGKLSI